MKYPLLSVVAFATLAAGARAQGIVISNATASINGVANVVENSVTSTNSTDLFGSNFDPNSGTAQYSAKVDMGAQQLTSHAEGSGGVVSFYGVTYAQAGVTASLTYDVEVVGPSNIMVPLIFVTPDPKINILALNDGKDTDLLLGSASLEIRDLNSTNKTSSESKNVEEGYTLIQGHDYDYDTFVGSESFSVLANTDLTEVAMSTRADADGGIEDKGNGVFVNETCSTSIDLDPYVEIDPSFSDASLYHLVFSPNIGNSLATPEPGPFFVMGVGMLGLLRRRTMGLRR